MADDRFGDIDVAAGQLVVALIYGAHRDPETFPQPEAFRPERYLDGETKVNFAFGAGPRLCVGVHLAMMELQVATARLVNAYALAPAGPEALRFEASATMRPVGGTSVRLT